MAQSKPLGKNLPLVVVIVVAAVLGVLIWLSMGLQPDGAGSITAIGNDELRELVDDGAKLVDVRTQSEYDQGHIEGAVLAEVSEVAAIAEDWDRDVPLVLICATGSRSGDAARALEGMGFEVYDHTGGLVAWDGPVTTDPTVASNDSNGGTEPSESGLPVMYEFLTDS